MKAGSVVLVGFIAAMAAAPSAAESPRPHRGFVRPVPGENPYFPVVPGIQWTFERTGPVDHDTWVMGVAQRPTAGARARFFTLKGYSGVPALAKQASVIRTDTQGSVFEVSEKGDFLWYRLLDPAGSSWVFERAPGGGLHGFCDDGAVVTVASRDAELTVPAGTFRDVVHLTIAPQCADGGTLEEWFAPGVGLVKRVENTVFGPTVSQLHRVGFDPEAFGQGTLLTELHLNAMVFINDLKPPLDPARLPWVEGSFVLSNAGPELLHLVFSGCAGVAVEVVGEDGKVLITAQGNDGGCCVCLNLVPVAVGAASPLVIPFSFQLMLDGQQPFPDGRYAVRAVLTTLDPEPIRPTATAMIEVRSTP